MFIQHPLQPYLTSYGLSKSRHSWWVKNTFIFLRGSKFAAKKKIQIPEDIAPAYFEALSKLPSLVAAASAREWDTGFLQSALCAIAAAKGDPDVAEAVQELSPEIAENFMEWFRQR